MTLDSTPRARPDFSASPASPASDADRTPQPTQLTVAGLAALLLAYMPVNFTFGSMNLLADPIGSSLDASPAGQQLILAAYTTIFAASLVVSGRLGDRLGRRRVLAAGSAAFVLLAAATAAAPTTTVLVVLRLGLGVAAGLVTPQVLSTIRATASGRLERHGVILFTAMSGISTVVGQLAAGAVTAVTGDDLGWRAVQLLTALIAAAALPGLRRVPESTSPATLGLDLRGASLLATSLLLLILPLTLGRSTGWPLWTFVSLLAGAVLLGGFWATQRHMERRGLLPVVPPRVLASPALRRGLLMTLLFFVTYGAFLYEISSFAQTTLALDTWGAALVMLGFGAVFIATSLLLPRLLTVLGERTMTLAALLQAGLLAAIGVELGLGGPATAAQPLLMLLGAAQAMMYGPVLQTVLSRTPSWAAGVAGGLFTTLQQLGLSLGVAVLGGLFWGVSEAAGSPEDPRLRAGLLAACGAHVVCALAFAALARRLTRLPSASGAA